MYWSHLRVVCRLQALATNPSLFDFHFWQTNQSIKRDQLIASTNMKILVVFLLALWILQKCLCWSKKEIVYRSVLNAFISFGREGEKESERDRERSLPECCIASVSNCICSVCLGMGTCLSLEKKLLVPRHFFCATMADILIFPCTRTGTGIGTGTSNGCPT